MNNPVALITGSAKRIGAEIASYLHANDFNIVLHYRNSENDALRLANELNAKRNNSAISLKADLNDLLSITQLAQESVGRWGKLDVLINNASSFFPTPVGSVTEHDWDTLINSNLKAPFFLAQALAPELKKQTGCIINIADIYADKPLKQHTIYSIAKAGNVMLTKSLAQELAPDVRVNGISPGAILWPEKELSREAKQNIISRTPLATNGSPDDIAKTVLFLIKDSPYISGQIIAVDGGRSLTI